MTETIGKRHLARVVALGCMVCGDSAVPHHIRSGTSSGMGLKASDFQTIPLCNRHHTTGGYGIAIHAGQEEWEKRYGTELEWLDRVRDELNLINGAHS